MTENKNKPRYYQRAITWLKTKINRDIINELSHDCNTKTNPESMCYHMTENKNKSRINVLSHDWKQKINLESMSCGMTENKK